MDNEQAYRKLYTIVSNLVSFIGREGEIEINAQDATYATLLDRLNEIDNGKPDNKAHGVTNG